eukprot:9989589-Ditylum_brightwellii.AAC.1
MAHSYLMTDGTFTNSKTEAVFFPSATQSGTSVDTSPVYVNNTGYVTYSDKFKYLGYKRTWCYDA